MGIECDHDDPLAHHPRCKLKKELTKCNNCHISGMAASLKKCVRCKASVYCTKECQRKHWKAHKALCNMNALHETLLQDPTNPLSRIPLPDEMNLVELDRRLAEWIKFHKGTLMVCSYHALSLPIDISRTRTHILHIIVEPRTDHERNPAKYFRVKTATVPSYAEAMGYGPPWPLSIQRLKEMRDESERTGRGTETAAGIECSPMGVQMLPFGSIFSKNFTRTKVLKNWLDILKKDVEEGKRLTRFGS